MNNRADDVETLIKANIQKWAEIKDTYNDFWKARAEFFNYLKNQKGMDPNDFFIYKMVIGKLGLQK